MTDKELRKLTRTELLELLLAQSREMERLNHELEQAQLQLEKREIALTQAGSIAEAALQLSGIFEAAQAAADQYLQNVMSPVTDTQEQCQNMLLQTQQQCDEMILSTRQAAKQVWEVIRQEIYNPKLDYAQWREISDYIDQQLAVK